jgi:predicted nucleotidyltransferase
MVTQRDYSEELVRAARSVLVEIIHLLGEYLENIVLVGGWVPDLLLSSEANPHIGSIDVDLALNHLKLRDEGYKSIQNLLMGRGYVQGKQPFIFNRTVLIKGNEITVQVDLLSGEYQGTAKSHRHQKIQGGLARKTRGCDLVFDNPVAVTIEGELPNGARDTVRIQVSSIVPFLVMKGMALDERLKEKDAWDIYYCVQNYPGGLEHLIGEFELHLEHGLVKEGLEKIAKHFASEKHVGPRFVADFEEITDPEERDIRERDAYEKVGYLLRKLGVL